MIKSFKGHKILQEMLSTDKGQRDERISLHKWIKKAKSRYFDTARIALIIERQELDEKFSLLKRRLEIFRGRVSQHDERLQAHKNREPDELSDKDLAEYEKKLSKISRNLREDFNKLSLLRSGSLRHSHYLLKREDLLTTRKTKFQVDLDEIMKSPDSQSYSEYEAEKSIDDSSLKNNGSDYSLGDNQAESYYSDKDQIDIDASVSHSSLYSSIEKSSFEEDSDNSKRSGYSDDDSYTIYNPANDPELLHNTFEYDSNSADIQNRSYSRCDDGETMEEENKERYGDDDFYSSSAYYDQQRSFVNDDSPNNFELDELLLKYDIEDESMFNWEYNYDNGAYLDALLRNMGPEQSATVKHFIISGNVFIGMEEEDVKLLKPSRYSLTVDTDITGPGAQCPYQVPVHPSLFRYLPPDMLDQLTGADSLGDSSAMGKLLTLVQLGYTVQYLLLSSQHRVCLTVSKATTLPALATTITSFKKTKFLGSSKSSL
ncbi:hypothetical protein CLU79DRAFT_782357 [Phycomyces nitens]|nr:hypothetical protein CLU79DRAFT_782357 [Phycomyces nitens]